MAQKQLVFTSKSPTPWYHGMAHALLPTHLPSFDGPAAMEEQRTSLEIATWQTFLNFQDDRPESSPITAIFGH